MVAGARLRRRVPGNGPSADVGALFGTGAVTHHSGQTHSPNAESTVQQRRVCHGKRDGSFPPRATCPNRQPVTHLRNQSAASKPDDWCVASGDSTLQGNPIPARNAIVCTHIRTGAVTIFIRRNRRDCMEADTDAPRTSCAPATRPLKTHPSRLTPLPARIRSRDAAYCRKLQSARRPAAMHPPVPAD